MKFVILLKRKRFWFVCFCPAICTFARRSGNPWERILFWKRFSESTGYVLYTANLCCLFFAIGFGNPLERIRVRLQIRLNVCVCIYRRICSHCILATIIL